MTTEEVQELMDLKDWSRTKLAGELGMTQNAVDKWFCGHRNPGPSASYFMRRWLTEARAAANVQKAAVPA